MIGENVDCVVRGGELSDQSLVARKVADLQLGCSPRRDYLAACRSACAPAGARGHCTTASSAFCGRAPARPCPTPCTAIRARVMEGARAATCFLSTTGTPTWRRAWRAWACCGCPATCPGRMCCARRTAAAVRGAGSLDTMPLYVAFPPNRHVSAKLRVFIEWVAGLMARHARLKRQGANDGHSSPGPGPHARSGAGMRRIRWCKATSRRRPPGCTASCTSRKATWEMPNTGTARPGGISPAGGRWLQSWTALRPACPTNPAASLQASSLALVSGQCRFQAPNRRHQLLRESRSWRSPSTNRPCDDFRSRQSLKARMGEPLGRGGRGQGFIALAVCSGAPAHGCRPLAAGHAAVALSVAASASTRYARRAAYSVRILPRCRAKWPCSMKPATMAWGRMEPGPGR
jgi:hypothetical protein